MRKQGKIAFVAFMVAVLTACGVPSLSSSAQSSSSSRGSSTSDHDETSSSSNSSSSNSSSSSLTSADKNTVVAIAATDNIGTYAVGETLNAIASFDVKLTYGDGKEKDVSKKYAYYRFKIKNDKGEEVDPSLPFASSGDYSLQVYYTSNPKIITDPIPFKVTDAMPSLTLTKDATPNFTYSDIENSGLSNLSYPSTGDIETLVIPLEFSDYPFPEAEGESDYSAELEKTFNGKGAADTGYWESVSSYYEKTSLGKLKFHFEIADTFTPSLSAIGLLDKYKPYSNADYAGSLEMVDAAIKDYKTKNGNDSTVKFDNDHDGYIDGLWVVYSAPDYSATSDYSSYADYAMMWAFCTDAFLYSPDLDSPNLHSFGWASSSFMNKGTAAPAVDAHTFIHETGHLLSLPDYYSYDIGDGTTSGCQGGLAMMDLNIGDQDSFSKISLGWADPYVVTDDCTVTIRPNVSSGDCVLLADNWNGTAFDEYLLFDLQVPSDLNELDSETSYFSRPRYFSESGVRAYHVDARLGEEKYLFEGELDGTITSDGVRMVEKNGANDCYLDDDTVKKMTSLDSLPRLSTDKTVSAENRTPGYMVINANSPSRAAIAETPYTNNRLLTLIGADNKNCEDDLQYASNFSLFQKGDCWTMERRGAKFFTTNPGHFNNGSELNWIISIVSCDDSSATLQFRKY